MTVSIDAVLFQLINEVNKKPEWKPIYEALNMLASSIDQTRERVGGDTDIVSTISVDLTGIQSEIDDAQDDILDLTASIDATNTLVATITAELEELTDELNNARSYLATILAKAQTAQQDIIELTERYDSGT